MTRFFSVQRGHCALLMAYNYLKVLNILTQHNAVLFVCIILQVQSLCIYVCVYLKFDFAQIFCVLLCTWPHFNDYLNSTSSYVEMRWGRSTLFFFFFNACMRKEVCHKSSRLGYTWQIVCLMLISE